MLRQVLVVETPREQQQQSSRHEFPSALLLAPKNRNVLYSRLKLDRRMHYPGDTLNLDSSCCSDTSSRTSNSQGSSSDGGDDINPWDLNDFPVLPAWSAFSDQQDANDCTCPQTPGEPVPTCIGRLRPRVKISGCSIPPVANSSSNSIPHHQTQQEEELPRRRLHGISDLCLLQDEGESSSNKKQRRLIFS